MTTSPCDAPKKCQGLEEMHTLVDTGVSERSLAIALFDVARVSGKVSPRETTTLPRRKGLCGAP